MNKKGVELTLQTIGIAILVLLVVAILAIVLSQGIREGVMKIIGFGRQVDVNNCQSFISGNRCVSSDQCPLNNIIDGDWSDCKDGKVCCK